MPILEEKKIYEFCRQTPETAEQAVKDLYQAKAALVARGIPAVTKLFDYVTPIYEEITAGATKPGWIFDRQAIKFLDAKLVKSFIANPGNKAVRDVLSVQLAYVHAAIGKAKIKEIYTSAEIEAIADGKADYYDDIAFAHSLYALSDANGADYADKLFKMLPAPGQNDTGTDINWTDVFMFALTLKALWRMLKFLSEKNQGILLQNYFYLSIVVGIPIRGILENFLTAPETQVTLVSEALSANQELLPTKLDYSGWRRFVEVVRNYLTQLPDGVSSGFALEQFVNGFYQGEAGRDPFIGWLREAISIILHLEEMTSS